MDSEQKPKTHIETIVDKVEHSPELVEVRRRNIMRFVYQRIIAGPGGSIVLHVVLIIVLLKLATGELTQKEHTVSVTMVQPKTVDQTPPEKLADLTKAFDKLAELPSVVDAVAPPTVSMDQEPSAVDAVGSGPAGEAGDSGGDSAGDLVGDLNMSSADSPIVLRGLWGGRSSGGRKDAIGKYGGGMGDRTEVSVLKALKWLKDHQYPDGSWGPSYKISMTGLALLSFLAHGETTASVEYGDAVRRGLRFMLKNQKDGMFRGGGPVYANMHPTQIAVYEHAIGTYAISEAYGLTSIPYLRLAMEDAVQVIIDGQHEGGSWDYDYKKGPEANLDVSLSGWHIQALEAALNAGAENKGLKSTIETGIRGLTVLADNSSGMFRYSTRLKTEGPTMPMTAVGVLCMQLTGHALDAEARAGTKVLGNLNFRWTKTDPSLPNQDLRQVSTWPLYAWYYITQARFQQGGKDWLSWNKQFAPSLCNMQNPDGSWGPAPASQEAAYGPVYCTALSTLMLEVYYRLLPTYGTIEVEKPKADEQDKTDDIVIKFG